MSLPLELHGRADCIGAGLRAELLALEHGWPLAAAGEVKLLVVELCSNATRHGLGGTCELRFDERGLEAVIVDQGPGLPAWALEGRVHRGGGTGLGAGLDCARRLADELVLENPPTGGARVVARRFSFRTPLQKGA